MRKVLSYVLILALVLSSFSMAFAGSATELKTLSDVEGNANQEAIEVAYDLGIVTGNPDGTFQPTKAVTRAEFAAMITRALAIPESALAGYAKTNFKDTAGYTWAVPYLAFCNSKGIMLGDGQGNAMPGKTITTNEAITMILRALGYTNNSSELVGVWPSNYVTKAQELNLYEDVAKEMVGVDKANAAQIIYNALTVQKVAVNSDGETKKLWDKEPNEKVGEDGIPTTLLTAGLNCEPQREAVVTNADIGDALINMAKHIGEYGTIYVKKTGDHEIVAFDKDCTTLTGRFTDGDKFVTTDEEKEYTVKNKAADFEYLVNGNGTNKVGGGMKTIATLTGGVYGCDNATDEYVLNVDLSGKNIKEIYSATEWTVSDHKKIEKADIDAIKDDHELLVGEFVEEDNDEIDYTQFQLIGVASLSDIKADDVVYVYADGDDIRKIEVGTKTVEGTVKSFKDKKTDFANKFNIGSATYKNAAEVLNGLVDGDKDCETIKKANNVGDNVKAYLDARGYVYSFDDEDSDNAYAVIEKKSSKDAFTQEMKLMFADGSEKTLKFDEDSEDSYKEADVFAADLNGNVAGKPGTNVGAVIGYALDKDGAIKKIDKTLDYFVADAANTSYLKSAKLVHMGASKNKENGNVAAKDYTVSSDVVVFTFDGRDEYDVTTIDKVDTGNDNVGVLSILVDDGDVVAMLVSDAIAKGGDESFAVVNEYNKTTNDDGDKVYEVVGFKDGAKLSTTTDDETTFAAAPSTPAGNADYVKLDNVALYKITVDAKGIITKASVVETAGKYVVVKDVRVAEVDARNSITAANGTKYALAKDVKIYQVKSDEYKLFTGSLKKEDAKSYDVCYLYNLDNDNGHREEYDVVIFARIDK